MFGELSSGICPAPDTVTDTSLWPCFTSVPRGKICPARPPKGVEGEQPCILALSKPHPHLLLLGA